MSSLSAEFGEHHEAHPEVPTPYISPSSAQEAAVVFTYIRETNRGYKTLRDYTCQALNGLDSLTLLQLDAADSGELDTSFGGLCSLIGIEEHPERIEISSDDQRWFHLQQFKRQFGHEGVSQPERTLAAKLFLHFGQGISCLSEDEIHTLHAGYLISIQPQLTHRQRLAKEELAGYLSAHIGALPTSVCAATEAAYRALQVEIVDELKVKYRGITSSQTMPETIDTANIRESNTSPLMYAAAYYSPARHKAVLIANQFSDENFLYFFRHELDHALHAANVQAPMHTPEAPRDRRAGIFTVAARRGTTPRILMHTNINEGLTDYRTRLRHGMDPLSEDGSYYEQRLVFDALLNLTGGMELWDNFSNARSSGDITARRNSYRALTRQLGSVGGKGFLNRLDVTWAIFGGDYVLDLLNDGAYDELIYVPPVKLKEYIRTLKMNTEVIEEDEIDSSRHVAREPESP